MIYDTEAPAPASLLHFPTRESISGWRDEEARVSEEVPGIPTCAATWSISAPTLPRNVTSKCLLWTSFSENYLIEA